MRTEIKTYTTADKSDDDRIHVRHDVYVLYGTISCAERYLILCVDRKCKTDVSAREHLIFLP